MFVNGNSFSFNITHVKNNKRTFCFSLKRINLCLFMDEYNRCCYYCKDKNQYGSDGL